MVNVEPLNKSVVRVTFSLPARAATEGISVVGDFNAWDPETLLMTREEDGTWSATTDLQAGRTYEFRYVSREGAWHSDDACPHCPNPFGSDNSLLTV